MKTQTHRIPSHIQTILNAATIEGLTLKLNGQLERKDYMAIMKVIELAGGRWDKRAGLHTFPDKPSLDKLHGGATYGAIVDQKKTRQAFYTPAALAYRVAEMACVSGCRVLEPSAGDGRLASACLAKGARVVQCIEIDPEACEALRSRFEDTPAQVPIVCGDFLHQRPLEAFDAVVINPPFTSGQDIAHVTHALRFLKIGGRLVAIMAGNTSGENWRKFKRDILSHSQWETEPLPAGSFSESGTDVSTLILTVRK